MISEQICCACGTEVRDGSLFCYNCGGAVGDEKTVLEGTSYANNGPGSPTKNGDAGIKGRNRSSRNALRKRSNEPVQVTWKRDEKAGIGFLLVSVIIAILSLALLGIAYYLH